MPASDPRRTVPSPRPPEVAPARRFPIVATIAPVVASVVLFAVTRSAFTLVFALLGPVVAVATVADAALQRRRTASRESRRFADDLDRARTAIDDAQALERAELDRRYPRAHSILGEERGRVVRWRGASGSGVDWIPVRLGSGSVESAVVLDGAHSGFEIERDPQLIELARRAATLRSAAITGHAHAGVGIAGPMVIARAAARGILLQFAAIHSPETTAITAPAEAEWDWLSALPHAVTRGGSANQVDFVTGSEVLRVAIAASVSALPRELDVVLDVRADATARLVSGHPDDAPGEFHPEFVCLEVAAAAAAALGVIAQRDGFVSATASRIPDAVALADLAQPSDTDGLSGAIGLGSAGPFVVDLVGEGPHAIVGGTTGSGKSELLISWVLAMAAERSPEVVTFLFVDFKGGAAFEPLAGLRHCVGVITDLDAGHSLRAIASLAAELRHRERALAALGRRSIDDKAGDGAQPFPRLVVVVDEYAALVETHSSLHAVFADIAARGRSLGVHLVLCTQRPAGVVRDGILANCALRISLRMLTSADSTAVLGTDAAAALASAPIGRALVGVAGATPSLVQVAHASRDDCEVVAARWAAAALPRVPWLPPLPNRIPIDSVARAHPDDSIPFALADLPELQSQELARYRPDTQGSLLVVGAAGSGKSGVLAALAAAPSRICVEHLPRELPALWDALEAASIASADTTRVLLLDDVDAVLSAADDSYREALRDRISGLLRAGRASGVHVVLTTQRVNGATQSLASLCGSTLVLRMPNQQEHVLAGGAVADFREDAVPGSATWRGHRLQVFAAEAGLPPDAPLAATEVDLSTASLVVVSTRPEEFAGRIRAAGGGLELRVADPETWQSHWTSLVAALRTGDVLFDGCTPTDLRTLARIRDLPPPFPRGERPLWLLSQGGGLTRARLPAPDGSS